MHDDIALLTKAGWVLQITWDTDRQAFRGAARRKVAESKTGIVNEVREGYSAAHPLEALARAILEVQTKEAK